MRTIKGQSELFITEEFRDSGESGTLMLNQLIPAGSRPDDDPRGRARESGPPPPLDPEHVFLMLTRVEVISIISYLSAFGPVPVPSGRSAKLSGRFISAPTPGGRFKGEAASRRRDDIEGCERAQCVSRDGPDSTAAAAESQARVYRTGAVQGEQSRRWRAVLEGARVLAVFDFCSQGHEGDGGEKWGAAEERPLTPRRPKRLVLVRAR